MGKDIGIQLNDNSNEGEIMGLKINPVRGADGKIISGIVIGNTKRQNMAILMIAKPGDLKFNPDAGVGLEDITLSEEYLYFRHRIREHLGKDGFVIRSLDFAENRPFKIDADYE